MVYSLSAADKKLAVFEETISSKPDEEVLESILRKLGFAPS